MNGDLLANVMILVLAITTISKAVVDLVRMAVDMPRWGPPLVAFVVSIGAGFLLMLANGIAITAQTGATAVLAGILAAGGAVAVTAVARAADEARGQRS